VSIVATPLEQLEGKYELLEKIREGGMGSVYKVRHQLLDEIRVIKVIRPQLADDETLKARFLREAKMAIRLRHPNIAQIYDFTMDENGYAYLVMEFIDGLNLQEIIKVLTKPPVGLVLEIADQSLDAIGYLHRKKVVHRDISPDNILVARDDDGALLIKLIDLGIAKEREGEDSLTSAGTFLGKVRYSSPEHFRTHEGAKIGARSDLYSFGVVLYELLTGAYPIKGSNIASLISGHLMHPPLDFDTSDPDGLIPEPLRAVVLKAMAKKPDDRFASAEKFRKAIAPFRSENPVEKCHLREIFEIPTVTTRSIRTIKPGSTQSRIDRNFGLSPTPPPGDPSDPGTGLETSGTVETERKAHESTGGSKDSSQSQVRALLLGAGKLVEGQHFDEARLQLATVLEIAPENTEARRLIKIIEAADIKLQQRRRKTTDDVRKLLIAGDIDRAEQRLDKALEADGTSDEMEQLRGEIGDARKLKEERLRRLEDLRTRSGELISDCLFDEALSVLDEAREIAPDDGEIKRLMRTARTGLAKQREEQRRDKEITDTASTISAHIDDGDLEQAERALAVALKLYGQHDVFDELETRLNEARTARTLASAEELRSTARELIDAGDFAAAVGALEKAHELVPDEAETDELLAAAREGIRLKEEAERRQRDIDLASLKIDRLILAGRLESAVRMVDETVEELGEFDEAEALRRRIVEEIEAMTAVIEKVQTHIDEALGNSDQEDFTKAAEALEAAQEVAKDTPYAAELVAEADTELQRRIDAHRRRIAIDKVVASIDRQLGNDAIDEARRELVVARRLYGASTEFEVLDAKIDAKAREQHQGKIEGLVERALAEKRPTDEALELLESAAALDPHNEKVQRLLVQKQAEKRRTDDERAEEHASETMDKVDRLIAEGEPAEALSVLNGAVEKHGDFRAARLLRDRLEDHLEA
jgi:serine/threonine protein kinase